MKIKPVRAWRDRDDSLIEVRAGHELVFVRAGNETVDVYREDVPRLIAALRSFAPTPRKKAKASGTPRAAKKRRGK